MKKYFLITFLSISIFCADAPKDFRRQKNTEMSYGLIAEEINFGQEDTSLAVIAGDPIWVEYFDNKASADEVIQIRSELDKMSSLVKTPNVDSIASLI